MHGVSASFKNDALLQARSQCSCLFRHAVIDGEEFVIFVLFLTHSFVVVLSRNKSAFA